MKNWPLAELSVRSMVMAYQREPWGILRAAGNLSRCSCNVDKRDAIGWGMKLPCKNGHSHEFTTEGQDLFCCAHSVADISLRFGFNGDERQLTRVEKTRQKALKLTPHKALHLFGRLPPRLLLHSQSCHTTI